MSIDLNAELDAFSHWSQVKLTVFDLEGRFKGHLHERHLMHNEGVCGAVKKDHLERCWSFDRDQLTKTLKHHHQGFWKVCHGGMAEWIEPIWFNERSCGCLGLGLFDPNNIPKGAQLQASEIPPAPPQLKTWPNANLQEIPALAQTLARRLEAWLQIHRPTETGGRNQNIRSYMERQFARPDYHLKDLANHLHLSEARVTQILKSNFDISFPEWVESLRHQRAKQLLRETRWSIKDVALEVGYRDPNYFMKRFKHKESLTPKNFRAQTQPSSI